LTGKYSDFSPDDDFKEKEKQQEKEIQDATEKTLEEKYSNYEEDAEHKIRELEQKEEIAKASAEEFKKREKSSKKKLTVLVVCLIFLGGVFGGTVFLSSPSDVAVPADSMTSQFLIQNLRGDTINTWISWKVTEGDLFHVHVVDNSYATQERLDAIVETIMSTEEIEIDDSLLHKGPEGSTSTYYVGWYGALNNIEVLTENPIPKNLHFHVTDKGEGDILIDLTNLSSPDGYSGYTKAIVDEEQHQILKATITIYNIESLSIEQLKTIVRHELGHGFGLAHSTAPEDLMHPTIITEYPYISDCDIDAIALLYDGGQSSRVVCDK